MHARTIAETRSLRREEDWRRASGKRPFWKGSSECPPISDKVGEMASLQRTRHSRPAGAQLLPGQTMGRRDASGQSKQDDRCRRSEGGGLTHGRPPGSSAAAVPGSSGWQLQQQRRRCRSHRTASTQPARSGRVGYQQSRQQVNQGLVNSLAAQEVITRLCAATKHRPSP